MTTYSTAPVAGPPHRVLLLGAATPGWYAADEGERARVLPRLTAVCAGWAAQGARLIASFDDDVLKVGLPAGADVTWYLLYDVPALQTVAGMLHAFRLEDGGVRLDRYFRLEAKVGRAFFPVEAVQP